jgi:hypothetical protein
MPRLGHDRLAVDAVSEPQLMPTADAVRLFIMQAHLQAASSSSDTASMGGGMGKVVVVPSITVPAGMSTAPTGQPCPLIIQRIGPISTQQLTSQPLPMLHLWTSRFSIKRYPAFTLIVDKSKLDPVWGLHCVDYRGEKGGLSCDARGQESLGGEYF